MSPQRNAPCPCGSGRKYKHCCGRPSGAGPFPEERVILPPEALQWARETPEWEADMVALPSMIRGKEGLRHVALLVVADEIAVETDIQLVTTTEVGDVAKALEGAVKTAATRVGVFPERVLVRRRRVADALGPLLREKGCDVESDGVLPSLDPVIRHLAEHLAGETGWPAAPPPPTWAAWGLPPELVGELFSAYARFYEAAPWRWFDEASPLIAEWSDGEESWVVPVMGSALGEYGLAVYSDPWDLENTLEWGENELPFQELEGWIVHLGYQHRRELDRPMLKEISRARWEVAGPGAYPFIMPILTPGGGLQEDQVRRMAELLRGVAALSWQIEEEAPSPEGMEAAKREGRLTLRYLLVPEGEEAPPDPLSPELEEVLEGLGEGDFQTLQKVRAEMEDRLDRYNAMPQEALGGISPDQAIDLLREGIEKNSHLRFSSDLDLEEAEKGRFFFNARTFLTRLDETDGAGATVAGNLKRVVVAEMLERMRLPEGYVRNLRWMNKVVNERDAWPVHLVRVNLELAGLIHRRKGTFLLTGEGRRLMSPDAAGELFRKLFLVHFGEFNLEYGKRSLSGSGLDLQAAVPLFLYQIGAWARDWTTVERLARGMLPEPPAGTPGGEGRSVRTDSASIYGIVLEPLEEFGLLEDREIDLTGGEEDVWWRWRPEATQVRVTPLFRRFISFQW